MKRIWLAVVHVGKMVTTTDGWRMISDGVGLLFRWARGGAKLVPSAVREGRIEACEGCDYHEPGLGAGICMGCGCFLSVKTWVADAECPATVEADGFKPRWGTYAEESKSKPQDYSSSL